MSNKATTMMLAASLCAVAGLAASAHVAAQAASNREGKLQFYVPISYVSGESIDGPGRSSFDLNDDVGWGVALGYNWTEQLMVGVEFTWLSAHYEAAVDFDNGRDETPDGTVAIGGTLDSATLQFVGQYNFMRTRTTPFIRANLGTTYADSNIPIGPAQGVCWWDPWWGYVCDAWQPTFDDYSFSFGGGIGVRSELGESLFLEASYNVLWVDLDHDTPAFDTGRLTIGFMF